VKAEDKVVELKTEYQFLLHALQSGVLAEIELNDPAAAHNTLAHGPKHLRVGVNSAIVQSSGLANLLIQKGVITEVEFWRSQVAGFREEVQRYEQKLSELLGAPVKLR